jgi:CO/xanthine dehydrogenase Mo-binding subunit
MRRLDLEDVIRGKGNYVDDIPFSGYYGVFVRSQYPHAILRKVDVDGARRKGALVLTAEDLLSLPNLKGKEEQEGSSSISSLLKR